MPSHQSYHKCSSRGPEEVLYLLEAIRNLRWLLWPMICQDISKFWTAFEVTRLARKVPQGILKNAVTLHYSKSNMVAPARLLKKVLPGINSSEIHQFTFISYSKKDNSSKTRDGCKWTRQIVQLYTWTQIKVKEHGFYCCSTFHIHSLYFNI